MRVCVFTASRSEYGLLKKLIFLLQKDKYFRCKLLTTGSHLLKKYGYSINEIYEDNLKIDKIEKIYLGKNSSYGVCNSFSKINSKINNYFNKNKFDLLILLGDRYETFAAAIASYINRIPICHIHGGEKTVDSLDDNFRHSISKLSNYHFVSHHQNKRRLIQLGENKKNIFIVGGIGANLIKSFPILKKDDLLKILKLEPRKKIVIINYYPEVSDLVLTMKRLKNIFITIKYFRDVQFIFTLPSHDRNNDKINSKIISFVKKNKNSYFFKNLGQIKYYSLLKYSNLMIGNSSSGILEMPSFKKYTINIGNRQKGRIFSKSVIQSSPNASNLKKLVNKYASLTPKTGNIYYKKKTFEKLIKILKKIKKKNKNNSIKEFLDI